MLRSILLLALIGCGSSDSKDDDTSTDTTQTTTTMASTTTTTASTTTTPPVDADSDGFSEADDCNDNDNTIYPGATEVCDEVDNNCDTFIDEGLTTDVWPDLDNDGFGDEDATATPVCAPSTGQSDNGLDCDDNTDTISPNRLERCDGIDDNCDGTIDEGQPDDDGDGVCNSLDTCPSDAYGDSDGDGSCDSDDPCPSDPLDTCQFAFTTNQVIDGSVVTCSSVTTTATYTECNELQVDGLYFPNGIICGPTWSRTPSSYTDLEGFCQSLTGSTAFEVYYACDFTQDRATWTGGTWGAVAQDNGYSQHLRCEF